VGATLGCAVQPCPELLQRLRLVLVAPQRFERLVVGVERGLESLDRGCEHIVGKPQTTFGGDGGVGDERGRARRAVDEREPFLLPEIRRLDQRPEQMTESEDLTRAAVPLQRHGRQRAAVQKRCDRLYEMSTDSCVAVEEVREPCEDDAADDALRQRFAERRCSERRSAAWRRRSSSSSAHRLDRRSRS
jgi:hypothetical protein